MGFDLLAVCLVLAEVELLVELEVDADETNAEPSSRALILLVIRGDFGGDGLRRGLAVCFGSGLFSMSSAGSLRHGRGSSPIVDFLATGL